MKEEDKDLTHLCLSVYVVHSGLSSLSLCVYAFPEEIKVNIQAYLLLPPKQDRLLLHFISRAPPSPLFSLLPPHHPSLLSSLSIDSVIWSLLVCPGNTTAQICRVSCIFYLLPNENR